MSYKHFNINERISIQFYLINEYSINDISKLMKRSKSSISDEIRKNSLPIIGYIPRIAQEIAENRRNNSKWNNELKKELVDYLIEKLKATWSPEQISNRLVIEFPDNQNMRISFKTIYTKIYNKSFEGITKANLRKKGKKYKHQDSTVGKIVNTVSIEERPERANKREEIGDWEIDTVRGKNDSKVCIATFADRKSRYYIASVMKNAKASTFNKVADKDFRKKSRGKVKSFTADNGHEFASHEKLSKKFEGAIVYFAKPHAPWEKPTNENENGLLREFFPKGETLKNITQEELDKACDLINDRPRKVLGWLSAREVFEMKE